MWLTNWSCRRQLRSTRCFTCHSSSARLVLRWWLLLYLLISPGFRFQNVCSNTGGRLVLIQSNKSSSSGHSYRWGCLLGSLCFTSVSNSRELWHGDMPLLKGGNVSTATDAAPAVADGSPEEEDDAGTPITSDVRPRPRRQARPNKQYVGPEWDV